MHFFFLWVVAAFLCFGSVACKSTSDENIRSREIKPPSEGPRVQVPEGEEGINALIFYGAYAFSIFRQNETEKPECSGKSFLEVYETGSYTSGKATCSTGIPINMVARHDRPAKGLTQEEVKERGLDNRVKWLVLKDGVRYLQPRPDFLSGLIGDPSHFKDLDISKTVEVEVMQNGKTVRDEGTIRMVVDTFHNSYKAPYFDTPFENVIVFTTYADGFKKIKEKANYSLYDQIEYTFSTKPVGILRIRIKSPLKDFEGNIFRAIAGGVLIDPILNIEMNLQDLIHTSKS